MAIRNKFYSLVDSPKLLQEFQRNLTETSTQGVLSQDCSFWPNPLMGVSLAAEIFTRASAQPMHQLKKSQRMFSRFLVEVENILLIRFNDFAYLIISM